LLYHIDFGCFAEKEPHRTDARPVKLHHKKTSCDKPAFIPGSGFFKGTISFMRVWEVFFRRACKYNEIIGQNDRNPEILPQIQRYKK
jgi:hypothetical protein